MKELLNQLKEFIHVRDWEQFHAPKNLAMALALEAAEIAEIFQWMTLGESAQLEGEKVERLEQEIGDVMIYLVELAHKFELDPLAAAKKLLLNNQKYPPEIVRGKAAKYTEY